MEVWDTIGLKPSGTSTSGNAHISITRETRFTSTEISASVPGVSHTFCITGTVIENVTALFYTPVAITCQTNKKPDD